MTFQALVVRDQNETFVRNIETRESADLPAGEVLIRVHFSSLNYKDALSASGNKGVTKTYPHTPGIDAAGEVIESAVETFRPGDRVLVTGFDLGTSTPGGFGQVIRVPAPWVLHLPEGLTPEQSMHYGTAGLTAGLSVYRIIEAGIKPGDGEILVTGATGGVGSLAVGILAKAGFKVVAATGKTAETPFLKKLGAQTVISRADADDDSKRPLLSGRWAGVVDTVGGNILATAIRSTRQGGTVTCCGMVASPDLSLTVFPFILRGVRLIGIDSAWCPINVRKTVWTHLAADWKIDEPADLIAVCQLPALNEQIDRILAGQMRGRVVVDLAD